MLTTISRLGLLVVGLGLIIVIAALVNIQGVSWSAETTPEIGVVNVMDLPVQYEIIREDNDYLVFASFAHTSGEEVQKMIQAMRQVSDGWVSQGRTFRVSIVFAKPLTVDEFRAFVKDAEVLVYGSVARAWRSDGNATEMLLPPVFEKDRDGNPKLFKPQVGGDPIDPQILAAGIDDKQMLGIVSTEVDLNADTYTHVIKDQRVIAIDVLKQVLIDLVQQKHPAAASDHIWVPQSMVYGVMEETGLVTRQEAPQP